MTEDDFYDGMLVEDEKLMRVVPRNCKTLVDKGSWANFIECKLGDFKTRALHKGTRSMNRLPLEIITKILCSLPTSESVLNCKFVCKDWQAALGKHRLGLLFATSTVPHRTQVFLMSKQINHAQTGSIVPETDFRSSVTGIQFYCPNIIGSCNGLVCFGIRHNSTLNDPVYNINPSTGEQLHLPKLVDPSRNIYEVKAGFGYCESTGEYKVVRTYDQGKIQVYTLGDGRGWRNKDDFQYRLKESSGIFAHGRIFWLDAINQNIVSFDLHTENLESESPPPIKIFKKGNPIHGLGLAQIGLSLCMYYTRRQKGDLTLRLWSLENTNYWGANIRCRGRNWVKKCSVEVGKNERGQIHYVPIALGKNNILLWRISMYYKRLCRYDLDAKTNLVIWNS